MEIVTISGYRLAQNQEGESFVVLEIMGEVELVQSSVTGRFYATSKKASITSTFSPEIAERLVGKELPGRIQQISCEPYSYMIPETGEEGGEIGYGVKQENPTKREVLLDIAVYFRFYKRSGRDSNSRPHA